eukprot:CAMPEP_0171502312 /NCGR_PEP_ID=MMETSP0958-20121227/10097_1 /TAXON_ID=87120 /ORGANISM="Aurantiochytrium limacinum, Strain ATCCMYA-1381" /LENGTH=534 /DNA_ID=CAMNT_0012037331 /DNA_START=152 /DNA_END=1756 /DNA_ORIENTATION=+
MASYEDNYGEEQGGDYGEDYGDYGEDYGEGEYGGYNDTMASDFNLLDRVRVFVQDFHAKISANKVLDVRNLYCKEWSSITSAYYKDIEWPRADEVAGLCDNDQTFLLFYNELYYRHIFVNCEPLIHHRFESWNNYRALFDKVLENDELRGRMIPSEWVNDMIDEFLYQFQDFCRYKHDVGSLSEDESRLLEENPNVWATETVLGYLTSFMQQSGVVPMLEASKNLQGARLNVLQSLGYFSIFGLCRMNCLMADYRRAVAVLAPVDTDDKRALFTRVPGCHVTLFYYLGFAYLMMRRYADALSVFSAVLLAHRGSSKDRNTSFADGQIHGKYDRIRALAAMAISLSPGMRVDQQVSYVISEKHADNLLLLNKRDESTFESLFSYACPKFIVPGNPNFGDLGNRHQEAYRLQLKLFLYEVRQQAAIPTIRSYLLLYTSIPITKLAKFCEMPPERFREYLCLLKSTANQVVHQDGTPALEGTLQVVNDIHFFIVGDMVFMDETKQPQRFAQYFMTYALKFQQTIDDMAELKDTAAAR